MAEVLEEFLARRHIAVLGTQNPSGSIQLAAIWYMHEGGDIYLPTTPGSVKVRNLRERPSASVVVDSRHPEPLKTASGSGAAEVIEGDAARELNQRIFRRYMSDEAIADPAVGGYMIENDVVTIRLRPERWNWVDLEAAFGGLFEPGYLKPLG